MNDHATSGELEQIVADLLGEPRARVIPLAVDAYNSHSRVELPQGERLHLVRYFNTGDSALEGIAFEHAVLLHLEDRGFQQLPRLIRRDGETIFRVGDDYFAFSQWIEGCTTAVDRPVTPSQVEGIARCLAEMHRAMVGFERRLAFLPHHTFVYPADEVRRQREPMIERLRAIAAGGGGDAFDDEGRHAVAALLPRIPAILDAFPWDIYEQVKRESQQLLVHGDLRLLNLVFDGAEVATVLDFNASFNEIRLWDLCYTALSLAGTETLGDPVRPERAATFLRAYHNQYPLSDAERLLMPHFLVYTVLKLMMAAYASWWVVQRAPLLEKLERRLAEDLCDMAL